MYKPNCTHPQRLQTPTFNKKTGFWAPAITLSISLITIMLLFGCTDWKKKYAALNVMHQNTLGLLDCEKAKNNQLTDRVTRGRLTIEEMQRQVTKGSWFRNISAAEVAGFGKNYNITFDHSAATITVTLANAILFNQEEAVIKKTACVKLDHIRSVLQSRYAGKQIDVIGHTDRIKDNREVAIQRSLSVVRYLVEHGIAEDKIRQVSCGSAGTLTPNTTVTGKAKNPAPDQSVEIVIYMD